MRIYFADRCVEMSGLQWNLYEFDGQEFVEAGVTKLSDAIRFLNGHDCATFCISILSLPGTLKLAQATLQGARLL